MMDSDLATELAEQNFLPKEALQRAVEQPDLIAEATLRVLTQAAEDPDTLSDQDVNLLFWGVHALAAARDTRIFVPLLRLLRHDDEVLEGIFGDAVSETIPLVLASAYDGDAAGFHRFLLDTTIDETVRSSAFVALGFLTREERLDPAETRALLVRFDDARTAVEGSLGWVGWEEAIAYLGFADLSARVEAARRDGRITDEFSDASWFRKTLKQVSSVPPNFEAFEGARYGYLDDPVSVLDWTAESFGQPVKNPFKTVGRNDPCPCGSGKKYKKCCLDSAAA